MSKLPIPKSLRIVAAHQPPFVFVDPTKSGNAAYTGALVDLLPELLKAAKLPNMTYTIYTSPSNEAGDFMVGHNYSGITGELLAGHADLSLFPLPLTASRRSLVDVTYSYLDTGMAMLVPKTETTLGRNLFATPFSLQLWLVLLAALFAMALVFWSLDHITRWSYRRINQPKKTYPYNQSHLLESWFTITQVHLTPRQSSWAVQVSYIAFSLFWLVAVAAYQSQLTTIFTSNRAGNSLNSIQDLYSSNRPFAVIGNSTVAAYFLNSKDFIATQMRSQLVWCDDTNDCLSMLRSGRVAAYVQYRQLLTPWVLSAPTCDVYVAGLDFVAGNLVFGLPKNSSLTSVLNPAILNVREAGLVANIFRKWRVGTCREDVVIGSSLDIEEFFVLYVMLAAGVGLALAWALLEVVCSSYVPPQWQHAVDKFLSYGGAAGRRRSDDTLPEAGALPSWQTGSMSMMPPSVRGKSFANRTPSMSNVRMLSAEDGIIKGQHAPRSPGSPGNSNQQMAVRLQYLDESGRPPSPGASSAGGQWATGRSPGNSAESMLGAATSAPAVPPSGAPDMRRVPSSSSILLAALGDEPANQQGAPNINLRHATSRLSLAASQNSSSGWLKHAEGDISSSSAEQTSSMRTPVQSAKFEGVSASGSLKVLSVSN